MHKFRVLRNLTFQNLFHLNLSDFFDSPAVYFIGLDSGYCHDCYYVGSPDKFVLLRRDWRCGEHFRNKEWEGNNQNVPGQPCFHSSLRCVSSWTRSEIEWRWRMRSCSMMNLSKSDPTGVGYLPV